MNEKRLKLGRESENAAEAYFKKKGYRIIEKNFRCKLGEIDIIADQGGELVFIEVEARADHQYGHPFNAVTPTKQRKIIKVAQSFLAKHQLLEKRTRFDVVGLTADSEGTFTIELLENAFKAG
ncbi:MAG: YraN family protein [Deltaproteobacteria bacterium]|nr:YraN family protein [Deltaproteobacteria bacterium]